MNALAPYIAAMHQQNLLEEAELGRLARRSRDADSDVSVVRRSVGGGARRLSRLFASAARTIDPSVDVERAEQRQVERPVGRALAC